MKPFPLPVVSFGPGSQQTEEEILQYMDMPKDMHTFNTPRSQEDLDPALREEALNVVRNLIAAMRRANFGAADYPRVEMCDVDFNVRAAVNDLLGEGEVAAYTRGPFDCRVQETAFAGVWRVLKMRVDGGIERDTIEACPIPSVVLEGARAGAIAARELPPAPAGAMNAPPVLSELRDASAAWKPGSPAHIVNLTLLPMTPDDLQYLAESLGAGTTVILSRGYGNCRISATAEPNVWWVQYFNSMDHLILNTIEVVDVPEVALAAKEDWEDSIERLEEWITVTADD